MIHRQLRPVFLTMLVLVLFGAMSGVATRVASQEMSPNSFGETVEVELVNVEVRVLDKAGMAVKGLTADDFQVFHDGAAVPISNFTEFRNGVAVTGAGSGSTAESGNEGIAADHHLIVYFDELHLRATHRGVLIEALREFISTKQIPAANIMILSQGQELNIEAPFGSTQGDLQNALNELATAPPGLGIENNTQQALDEIQRTWNQSRDLTGSGEQGVAQIPGANIGVGGVGGTGNSPRDVTGSSGALSSGNVPTSCKIFKSRVEAILNSWMRARTSLISVTLASLADSATYLAGLPGAKSVLFLSDALETIPGAALSSYADTICPGGSQNLAMNSLGEELGSSFMALTRHAAANRVTIYSVQGGGLQVSSVGSAKESGVRAGSVASFEASRRAGDQSGLIMLAEETGGRAVLNQNDYGVAFAELSGEMLNFYSLAYQPPTGDQRPEHNIEIRMPNSDLDARYRQGYMQKSANKRFSESLQGALYLGLVDNPLEARLGAGEFRSGGDDTSILPLQVVLPVDLVSFVPKGDDLMAGVLIRILTRKLDNGQVTGADKTFQIKHDPNSGGEWMQLPVDLTIGTGPHLLVVGILDQESGVRSLISTTIEVPET